MLEPGFHYDVDAAVYHADPCPEPSLSASIANLILDKSPRHAYLAHPRLNPTFVLEERDPTRPAEIGTVAHKLLLGRGRDILRIPHNDYRTNEAKTLRKAAYESGRAPILESDWTTAADLSMALTEQLRRVLGPSEFAAWEAGPVEVAMIGQTASGIYLRSLADRLVVLDGRLIIYDLKTGLSSAAPQDLSRRVVNNGYEVAAAFYMEVAALAAPQYAGRVEFRWLFAENAPPHMLTVARPDATTEEMGARKARLATAIWGACIETSTWPGYPTIIHDVGYPKWEEAAWMDRELTDFHGDAVR